ncbi:MAG: ABC transporter ATP-binding protein [Candidatus Bathyarchaeota archaeon]|nr:ABC transporter ATP-binding protein [Candidatus Bathyarchaeota archaeon]
MTSVTLQDVSKNFGATIVLQNIDWEILDGEFMVLVGPSGCGKTTLLKVILGALQPDSGHIYADGNLLDDVPIERRNVGFVPQDFGLFPHLTVHDNIAYGLRVRKRSSEEVESKAKELIEMSKLAELEYRKPNQLSWGQQQRVALARALAIEPNILLLDEPLSAVDWIIRKEIAEDIKALHEKLGITTIYVTHDVNEAVNLGHRLAVMNQGRLEQCDTPSNLVRNPKTSFVARFIHSSIG